MGVVNMSSMASLFLIILLAALAIVFAAMLLWTVLAGLMGLEKGIEIASHKVSHRTS